MDLQKIWYQAEYIQYIRQTCMLMMLALINRHINLWTRVQIHPSTYDQSPQQQPSGELEPSAIVEHFQHLPAAPLGKEGLCAFLKPTTHIKTQDSTCSSRQWQPDSRAVATVLHHSRLWTPRSLTHTILSKPRTSKNLETNVAEARSVEDSFFSSCSTNSGGSSLADFDVVVEGDVDVIVDEPVLDGTVSKLIWTSSSSGKSPAAGEDAVVVGDPIGVIGSWCHSGNADPEQYDSVEFVVKDSVVFVVVVCAQIVEVGNWEEVALDKGRISKSFVRKKHHEFHFLLDAAAIAENTDAGGDLLFDGEHSKDTASDFLESDEWDSEDFDGEGADKEASVSGDLLLLIVIANISLNCSTLKMVEIQELKMATKNNLWPQ